MNRLFLYPILFLFFFTCSLSICLRAENAAEQPPRSVPVQYNNSFEVNPTSESCYLGYERLMHWGDKAILSYDITNTCKQGDDFGRTGLTWRWSFQNKHLYSARLETAWIEGLHNMALRLGYDNRFFGCILTGIKSLSDPETIHTQETVLDESASFTDTFTGTRGQNDVYDRAITTTRHMLIKETRNATPDGILCDIDFNFFKQFHFSAGGSYWKKEQWNETGFHTNVTWQLTQSDIIGGHFAKIGDNQEGGIFYKKRFNSFRDIFRVGPSYAPGEDSSLLERFSAIPFSLPPIRIITAQTYVKKHQETRVQVDHEERLVQNNKPPVINSFSIVPVGVAAKVFQVTSLNAADPDGTIVSWSLRSNRDGVLRNSAWPPPSTPFSVSTSTSGLHTITLTVTDNQGESSSADASVNV
jgi:hypothetical protein